MSTHRFFVPSKQIFEDTVCIRGTDVWHIHKVLRLSQGDQVIAFDGVGHEYRVALSKIKPREILGTIVEHWERHAESPLRLTLVQGLPKANKMDLIVQKASEIGVNTIIPLQTERSDVGAKQKNLTGEKASQKLDRWSRIGIEAAKQSGRTAIPRIDTLLSIEEFLAQSVSADLRLLLWEEEQEKKLKTLLQTVSSPVQSAIVVIGPEGGFTQEEAAQFRSYGYQSVSLGKRILRTETAGLVVLGILQYEYGDY
jgi:16S rRNA (uracil1498-N3)-methyltransferase